MGKIIKLQDYFIGLVIALIVLFAACGCKSRQVHKSVSTYADQTVSASKKVSNSISTDNSHKTTTLIKATADSADTEMDIQNDSGRVQQVTVAPDGSINYSGPAKNIKIKTRANKHSTSTQSSQVQKAVTVHKNVNDSTNKYNNIIAGAQIKDTKSSIDLGRTLELIGIIGLVCFLVFIYFKWKLKPAEAIITTLEDKL